jgi:FlaA1/EpsC-like NDP-sugar epimerase
MAFDKLSNSVLELPRFFKRVFVLLVDIGLSVLSVILAFYLRLGEWSFFYQVHGEYSIGLTTLVAVILAIPIFVFSGLYREIFRYSGWFALLTLMRAMALYGVTFFFIFSFVGINGVPRTIGIIQPIILLLLVLIMLIKCIFYLGIERTRYGGGHSALESPCAA